jgi:hypothetical protein
MDDRPDFQRMIRDSEKQLFDVIIVWKLDRGMTMKDIRVAFTGRGVKTPKGEPLAISTIERMLRNRRYIGEYRQGDVVNSEAIPPIVPTELFDSVQAKLAKNAKAPARHKASDDKYLLSTKLFCGDCGVYMVGESGTSRTRGEVHRYYKCGNAKRGKGCTRKAVKKARIEDIIVRHVKTYLESDAVVGDIANAIMDAQNAENVTLPLLEKQLAEAEKGIANMLDAIQQGILTPSTKERLEELETRREEISIAIAQENIAHTPISKKQIIFWLVQFRDTDTTVYEQRQRLADTFVNAVYVYDDKILLVINGEEGSETITLSEVRGSDMDSIAPPQFVRNS